MSDIEKVNDLARALLTTLTFSDIVSQIQSVLIFTDLHLDVV